MGGRHSRVDAPLSHAPRSSFDCVGLVIYEGLGVGMMRLIVTLALSLHFLVPRIVLGATLALTLHFAP